MTKPAKAGDTTLELVKMTGFEIGDNVMVGKERNVIAGMGSMLLKKPLEFDHPASTGVSVIANADDEGAGGVVPVGGGKRKKKLKTKAIMVVRFDVMHINNVRIRDRPVLLRELEMIVSRNLVATFGLSIRPVIFFPNFEDFGGISVEAKCSLPATINATEAIVKSNVGKNMYRHIVLSIMAMTDIDLVASGKIYIENEQVTFLNRGIKGLSAKNANGTQLGDDLGRLEAYMDYWKNTSLTQKLFFPIVGLLLCLNLWQCSSRRNLRADNADLAAAAGAQGGASSSQDKEQEEET